MIDFISESLSLRHHFLPLEIPDIIPEFFKFDIEGRESRLLSGIKVPAD